ncbi:uncharacterized protein TRIADDRAFT_57787 [Trichoplax adhaerens]|uniref:C3H1-type domain-containing protein n=1 Tax=Trichoplax adhaerens TaxID=10228 RepID=B3S1D1_TRIAD|nr:hypothetical protein TRIADDRAFT_57787 [Trichoplax adhaerens]EDV23307.1 hypothetical protein TRIADDRAFT_57787 [Trichoplax adhaerens]|eukprot:XP_002114217.1 hypothetical protein TRIADDRAFT_57787 [Trichoplax adhaerens]
MHSSAMSQLVLPWKVAVVIVDKSNVKQLFPSIIHAINSASFVAIDLELSGLGNRKDLGAASLDDRYKVLSHVAATRAIIALGISCFHRLQVYDNEDGDAEYTTVMTQTFNMMTLCDEAYTVDPESLQFLVHHGFNFNRQYSSGISFRRGNDKTGDENPKIGNYLRRLLLELIKSKKPIIVHNGLADLVFLYQNLYLELPLKLDTFVADLSEMFEGGIYDTKYIARVKGDESSTYLQYVFRKLQRENVQNRSNNDRHIITKQCDYPKILHESIDLVDCSVFPFDSETNLSRPVNVCQPFATRGYCPSGIECNKSHNIDDVLFMEEQALTNKRSKKRKIENDNGEATEKAKSETCNQVNRKLLLHRSGIHRAGFDAYMTGFIFAYYSFKHSNQDKELTESVSKILGLRDCRNRIHLNRKTMPLQIVKSQFAKSSNLHKKKLKEI